uniref:NADH dehydrogenase subunit 4L n=1 Tax=Artyfechinostomum sufrartyfex TaxID=408854 RepID=A0A1P8P0J9_9TREM|nr:NADH dehydrogenase subunit 4L [Artyfechinostomum sufrartyfex]YP_010461005.1 NADH dehydrogenase subunit 4L [Artyfechinostomum malayanum]APX55328.1 NADH dehydrogenase subunit 4L [Artyfechinostomum sufrartyfex]ARH10827.1 NADH dehydrogenase subunit 4L [Artyfechinostomum sufrartyfex]UUF68158.1 NADH dehydrogenase subunit 4L [Artyfechinostomum malayanum]
MYGSGVGLLYLGSLVVLFSFFMSLSRLLNCLIVVENFNVLLLLFCLLGQWDEFRMLFIALIVIFTIEVTLGLVVLTRLWDSSSLIGIVGE